MSLESDFSFTCQEIKTVSSREKHQEEFDNAADWLGRQRNHKILDSMPLKDIALYGGRRKRKGKLRKRESWWKFLNHQICFENKYYSFQVSSAKIKCEQLNSTHYKAINTFCMHASMLSVKLIKTMLFISRLRNSP